MSYSEYPKVNISRVNPPDKTTLDFSLFWNIWDTMEAKYYDKSKLVPAKMVYGAIKGMVSSTGDPYTVFLEPKENKVVEEDLSGSFSGIGIQIGYRDKQLSVIAPLPGTPAEKAGLKAGDYILNIKDSAKGIDTETVNMSIPQAVELIRGPLKSKVTLTIYREGEDDTREVTVERDNIDVPSVTIDFVGENKNIAHIRVIKFSGDTADEWHNAVLEVLKDPNANSIIIDLRNNPGGYLEAAVDLASEFMDTGDTAVIQENGDGSKQEFKVQRLGVLKNYKGVVIVNGGSASASEILAGALRDRKSFKIVGEKSFGKGTIQEPEVIEGGAGLHITIAKWLTPSGYWVNEKGLIPDVEVTDNPDTEEDEQLQEAIKLVTSEK